ncbi:hypothetical protein B0H17DRAFT_1194832 [Mycena rosella]|uniref:Uncharacterized protein n=1 Tax=Mycena rosella TaxID=1033263 RepID=A0AAD7GR94_MYCRO|nr:hypothetical protein B0H17DRAFT_1194832 [Mycena rosella]
MAKSKNTEAAADDVLKTFIERAPKSQYTFDSERGAPTSEICRSPPDADPSSPSASTTTRDCITLQMHSTRLFAAMQNLGFFCALPMDPERTHMECTRIPK